MFLDFVQIRQNRIIVIGSRNVLARGWQYRLPNDLPMARVINTLSYIDRGRMSDICCSSPFPSIEFFEELFDLIVFVFDELDKRFDVLFLGLNEEEGLVRGVIRGCMGSVSKLCVIQMQDYLELGASARMNFPGTLSANNWTWRARSGFMTEELTKRIFETTRRYGRL